MPPAVVGNVMLRWESIVLWWFYPWIGLGEVSADKIGARIMRIFLHIM